MAFFAFVIKAALLKKKLKKYEEEKGFAINEYLYGETRRIKESRRNKILKKLEGSSIGRYLLRFKAKNTKENFFLKSITGFLGGVALTYIYLFFFIFGLRFPLRPSTYICAIAGIIFCLGLAFSRNVRCYVLLMIPVFFSKQGRQVILSYALYLSFTGPFKNTLENIGILSDSLACGQEMIKRAMKQIEDMVKAPFRAMKETLSRIVKSLKEVIKKIKDFLSNITRIIVGILHVIKVAVSWLGSIINFCNKKLGTPFQRCMKTFDDAIEDCKAKMGIMDFLCHVVHVVRALCYTVKFLDLICLFTEFVSESIIGVVKRKLKEFGTMVKTMFYVSIEYSHSLEYNVESSNSTKMVAKTIIKKMVERFEHLNKFFNLLGWAFSFFFIYIFFRVYYYKYKYMSSDRYDNRYITKHIAELDLRRLEMKKETVLPLERRERKHFCRPTSLRLLRDEQQGILNALMMLSLSTLEMASFIVCDYCLYWVLFTIYKEGHREYAQVQSGEVELYVSGRGPIADFYKKLGKALKVPKNADLHLDPVQCLPDPIPPDRDRYIQIAFLIGTCWVLAVTEAYGLRLRNIVMSHYYPNRAKERAVWLYNHILRSRGSFLKFARRQLRRKMMGGEDEPIEKVTFKERLFAAVPLLGTLFGKSKEDVCLLCGARDSKNEPLIRCKTPGCVGKYCINCYATLNNICTVCQNPIEYGDVSDISEERDSSEEDYEQKRKLPVERSSTGSNTESESEDTTTFRDVETRPKFRDLEKNSVIDFAQTLDFGPAQESETEGTVKLGKLLNTPEAYKLMRKKTRSLLSKLRKQRSDKLKALKNRKMNLVNALKKRLKEQKMKLKRSKGPEETTKYNALLRKAKALTKKLNQKKSEELLINGSDWNKENESETLSDNTDYGKLRSIVLERMKRTLRERRERSQNEMDVNYMFNRERRPYPGVFPARSANVTSFKGNIAEVGKGRKSGERFSRSFGEVTPNGARPSVYHVEREIHNVQRTRGTATAREPARLAASEEKKFVHLR